MAFTGLNEKITLRNSFDVMGRRISQTAFVGQQDGYTNHWSYNNIGQTAEITQGKKRVEYSYNLAGQRTGVDTNVYHSSLSYDGMGRLTGIDYKNPVGEMLAKYALTWDTAGRIVAMNLNGEPAQYGYDVINQLVSASYKKLPPESYQYDLNGNRKNFVTGKNNQLTNDGEFLYTYDGEGNRIEKRSKDSLTRYEWDHRNRLVKVIVDGKPVEYVYDYRNRLVKRNDEFFVHDGWQIMLVLDSQGNVKERFLWGAKQDELLCENDNWTLCDHLGTVRDVVNAKGKVVSHLEYNAFGKLLNVSGAEPRFRYTGKLFDDDIGLQWNINRWYDQKVGRWCSEYPIGFGGRDINLSRYVKNFTTNAIDINGLKYTCVGLAGGATAITSFFIGRAAAATTAIPLYGLSFSAALYGCYGYSSVSGWYCGACAVLSVTWAVPALGFYFSLGAGPSILFNPFDPSLNRPDPGLGIAVGRGVAFLPPYTTPPIIPEVTVDISLPKGDMTITVPKFGWGVGAYFAFRITGTCTGCTNTMFAELSTCYTNFEQTVNNAILWVENFMWNNGAPGNPNEVKHIVNGNGPAHNPVLVEAGIVQ